MLQVGQLLRETEGQAGEAPVEQAKVEVLAFSVVYGDFVCDASAGIGNALATGANERGITALALLLFQSAVTLDFGAVIDRIPEIAVHRAVLEAIGLVSIGCQIKHVIGYAAAQIEQKTPSCPG